MDPLKIVPGYIEWEAYWDPEGPIGHGKTRAAALSDLFDQCDDADGHAQDMLAGAIVAALVRREEYDRANPLGGPASMFRVMAERIEAGEAYAAVLADYGVTVGAHRSDCGGWRKGMPPEGEVVWISGVGSKGRFYESAERHGNAVYMFDQVADAYVHECLEFDYWMPITPPGSEGNTNCGGFTDTQRLDWLARLCDAEEDTTPEAEDQVERVTTALRDYFLGQREGGTGRDEALRAAIDYTAGKFPPLPEYPDVPARVGGSALTCPETEDECPTPGGCSTFRCGRRAVANSPQPGGASK